MAFFVLSKSRATYRTRNKMESSPGSLSPFRGQEQAWPASSMRHAIQAADAFPLATGSMLLKTFKHAAIPGFAARSLGGGRTVCVGNHFTRQGFDSPEARCQSHLLRRRPD